MDENKNIYDFENHMIDSVITEKAKNKTMYDIRKMSEYIKKVGRSLTEEEIRQFICD